MHKLLLVLLCLTLAGCAKTGDVENTKTTAKNDIGYECEKIRITGKLIPKTVCTTKVQRKTMEDSSKEALRDSRRVVSDIKMHGN